MHLQANKKGIFLNNTHYKFYFSQFFFKSDLKMTSVSHIALILMYKKNIIKILYCFLLTLCFYKNVSIKIILFKNQKNL